MIERIRMASPDDASAILGIYAPYVRDTPVSFEVDVPSEPEMRERIAASVAFAPWLVCERGGRVVGYAYASRHRARQAYQWTVEVSVYVAPDLHHRGIARRLYARLLADLEALGFRNALAGICLPNAASVAFHEAMGFSPIGVYRSIGYKLGRWHDVGWWQKLLGEGPPRPLSAPSESYPKKPG